MSALTDWFYNNLYGGNDLATQGHALDAQLQQMNTQDYGPGGTFYTPGNWAAVQDHLQTGSYDYQVNQDLGNNSSNGIGSVLKDVFTIAAIGGVVWAFFTFGGVGFLKSLAKKSKWYAVGIAGAVGILFWFVYKKFKQTAADTQSTVAGVTDSINTLL